MQKEAVDAPSPFLILHSVFLLLQPGSRTRAPRLPSMTFPFSAIDRRIERGRQRHALKRLAEKNRALFTANPRHPRMLAVGYCALGSVDSKL